MRRLTVTILLGAVFWATAATAQFLYLDQTPMVRFTGELLSPDNHSPGDLSMLTVFIGGKHWLFRLAEVEELTGSKDGGVILRDLFRRQVRFYGPEDLLLSLQKPELMGKQITLEGHLYTRERRFLIMALKEATKVALQNQENVKIDK